MAAGEGTTGTVVVITGEMAYGAHAVARADGKVLFVRGAAPHEDVEVVVREARPRYAFADLLAVRRRSAARRDPPCPYLPRCGGCPWQHLEYSAQLAAKQRIVAEQLRRLARLEVPVPLPLPSRRELGYRRRLKLRVAGGRVGFHAAASHDLVAVAHCLLAAPHVDRAIAWLPPLVAALRTRLRRLEIHAQGAGDAVVVSGEAEGGWHAADEDACRGWLAAHAAVAGLALRGRGWSRTWGEVVVTLAGTGDGPPLQVRAPGFTQVNDDANRLLVAQVLDAVAPRPGLRVLDLYAGAGNLSLPLRRAGALVTAVEQDRGAAADAQAQVEREAGPAARILALPAARAVRQLADAGERFDAVVLDPPRSGAAACLTSLLRLAAPRLVYVSCDPSTLARDLRQLSAAYRVDRVQPIDFFPQTYHVETVVTATLACDPHAPDVAFARRHDSTRLRPRSRRRRRTS
jgi:23S rRNA (uracil1939-C5)-methyltransferase